MTPLTELLRLVLKSFACEWRAHRSLWLGAGSFVLISAVVFGLYEGDDAWMRRLFDGILVLELFVFGAFLLVLNGVADALPKQDPKRDAARLLWGCAAGFLTSIAGTMLLMRILIAAG